MLKALPANQRGAPPAGELPKGVVADHALPHPAFTDLWDAILLDGGQKDRLLAQAVLTFRLRPKVDPARLPLHGLILLVGPPGTGKTSLARGLGSRAAEVLGKDGTFRYLEVEPHALANAGLGRSQQAVQRLLGEVIPERAAAGPLVVMIDEVETLAADRAKLSLDANPVDVHRATDAVLAGLDQLAAAYPRLLFLATSNFEAAVDTALLSRADLVETIPLPGRETVRAILADTVRALADAYPKAAKVLDDAYFERAVVACEGLDGRQIRKVVASACTFDKQTALDPGRLTAEDLIRAAQAARRGGGAR